MKTKYIFLPILFLIAVLASGDNRFVSAANEQKRVRFQITTISENASGDERKILAQTTIEGLPGTDFNINLQTENFKMQTRFLSDLVSEDKIKLRAKLNTRRFYGRSPANLPLYEEDAQSQVLQVGFDETVVLLPFGRNGETAETLKIEITPVLIAVSKTDESSRELKINFDKQIPSGEISIEASTTPHRFAVEAALLADGREVASGTCQCLLEEGQKIVLRPNENADSEIARRPLAVNFTVNGYSRSRPADSVAIKFDLRDGAVNNQTAAETGRIISSGTGAAPLGSNLNYKVEDANLPGGKKYELRFKVRLAAGEQSE